jgi:putative drug exporter of the RND superfamily
MVERLGRACCRHRWRVVALWLLALAVVGALSATNGGKLNNNLDLPGTESQRAFDLLQEKFPELAGDTATVAFRAEAGVGHEDVRTAMTALFATVSRLNHVVAVSSPYDNVETQISRDGRIAFAPVQFDRRATEVPKSVIFDIQHAVDAARTVALQVELGGEAVRFAETEGPGEREGFGLAAAVVILLVAFGSIVAMGLPLAVALFGIGVSLCILTLGAHLMAINVFAPQVASMIGLGVGIDYALFIVTRFREGLREGLSTEDAVARALGTAGRAVVFAGTTVVISLTALVFSGMPFIYGFAAGPALAVAVMVVAALTLLPALLGALGSKVDNLRLPWGRRQVDPESTAAYRWSRFVQRHPWAMGGLSLAVLLTLAVPTLAINLGWAGAGTNPDNRTTRRAYDLLAEGFGPGFNEPLLLVASLPGPGRLDALGPLLAELPAVPGVAFVSPPRPNAAGDVAAVTVIPRVPAHDEEGRRLIAHLRDDVVPATTAGTGASVDVAGLAPLFADMGDVLGGRLPWVFAGVLASSFLLLTAVFRSVLVPLKAAVMNLLSIGAAYGVVVAVFQWGWVGEVAGIDRAGPIESFIPIILFAILFGLSMDYEVFLLSRMREEFVRTGDNSRAVADGLASTARVITAAAAIMVTLFFSFVLGEERIIKIIGLGLGVAVLVDATLVRMLLVPATMELLGRANWWFPAWLDRLVPTIRVERGDGEHPIPVPLTTPPPVATPADPEPAGLSTWPAHIASRSPDRPADAEQVVMRVPYESVVVVPGQRQYHHPDCRHAAAGAEERNLDLARSEGYEACKACQS